MLEPRTRHLTVDIYGRRDRSRVADQVARVYAVPQRPLRIVAVEPLTGGRRMQAFYSTGHEATAEQVLTWYARRWSIEVAFHDAKGHLGFEQPQGWTRKAVERSAPTAMLLYSLIVLWFAADGHRHSRAPNRPWYRSKSGASFADMLSTLRECPRASFVTGTARPGLKKHNENLNQRQSNRRPECKSRTKGSDWRLWPRESSARIREPG